MMEYKKTILITGALGHIGSRLIRGISRTAAGRVILLDNMESQRYASLFDLPGDLEYQFLESDIRTADFAAIFSEYRIGAVVHLAALTDAANSAGRTAEVM